VGTPLLTLLHLIYVILLGVHLRRLPLGNIMEFMSLLALVQLLIYLVVERRYRVMNTGFVVVGLSLLFQFLSSAFMSNARQVTRPLLEDGGYVLHALLVLLAYTALSLAFLYSLLYVLQSRALVRRNFGLLYRRLPSLDLLERMSVGAVKLGVPLLLGANLAGHLWMRTLSGNLDSAEVSELSSLDAKVIGAWVTLGIYAVGLLGHRFLGWRGRRMSIIAILTFLAVVVATGLVHHFAPSFHNFHPGATS
jgi:ABC-type uncharacterized transport system permease subunit